MVKAVHEAESIMESLHISEFRDADDKIINAANGEDPCEPHSRQARREQARSGRT